MLKIGLDLDGVVIDSETTFRTYEEIFDIEHNQIKLINKEEPKFQQRYNWSKEEENEFINKYMLEVSKNSNLMSGFKTVYNLLKDKVEFVIITARGGFIDEMKDDAENLLKSNGININKAFYKINDKLDICIREQIDIMIDDDYRIIEKISSNNIRTLYFRDTNLKKLEETEFIKEVNNWGDVYRYITDIIKEV